MPGGRGGDSHRYYEDLAVAHVLGGLETADGALFRAHLLECSDCRARVWELRALAHDLADVERNERRVRAAQTLETKEREQSTVVPAEVGGARSGLSRGARVLAAVGLVALVVLGVWTAMLRGTVARQEVVIDELQAAQTVLASGEPARVVQEGSGVEGSLTVDGDRMVLQLRGVPEDVPLGVFFLDDDDEVLRNVADLPSDGVYESVLEVEPGTERVVVTSLVDGPAVEPTGPRVFVAVLP